MYVNIGKVCSQHPKYKIKVINQKLTPGHLYQKSENYIHKNLLFSCS